MQSPSAVLIPIHERDALVLFMLSEGGSDAIARAARMLAGPGDRSKILEQVLGREVREEELVAFLRKELGAPTNAAPK